MRADSCSSLETPAGGDLFPQGPVCARFAEFQFDQGTDIAPDDNGVWRWNTEKAAMHDYVRGYFVDHREDGQIDRGPRPRVHAVKLNAKTTLSHGRVWLTPLDFSAVKRHAGGATPARPSAINPSPEVVHEKDPQQARRLCG